MTHIAVIKVLLNLRLLILHLCGVKQLGIENLAQGQTKTKNKTKQIAGFNQEPTYLETLLPIPTCVGFARVKRQKF